MLNLLKTVNTVKTGLQVVGAIGIVVALVAGSNNTEVTELMEENI